MKEFIGTSLIGKQAWPIDNSRQYNVITGEHSSLAGTRFDEPKMVTIISEPYKLKYLFMDKEHENEFVTVMCDNKVFVCLNSFYFSFESAMDAHESFINSCDRIHYF